MRLVLGLIVVILVVGAVASLFFQLMKALVVVGLCALVVLAVVVSAKARS